MKTCTTCKIGKPFDAFAKSKEKRDGRHSICKACDAARRSAQRAANIEIERAKDSARYAERRGEKRAYDRAYYAANADTIKANTARYQVEHRERLKPIHADRQNRRRARKAQAMPMWSEAAAIREVYLTAKFLTDVLGEPYHVDHIVPLQGPTVCGLHVAANLRVLPARENKEKSNRVWPDMWEAYV